jgi:hypothetical protein
MPGTQTQTYAKSGSATLSQRHKPINLGFATHLSTALVLGLLSSSCGVVVGCSFHSSSLTARQYRAQAASICEGADRALNSSRARVTGLAQEVALARQTVQASYDALARLRPPASLARLHSEMLEDTRRQLARYSQLIEAARLGAKAFVAASAEQAPVNSGLAQREAAVWTELGIPACNRG